MRDEKRGNREKGDCSLYLCCGVLLGWGGGGRKEGRRVWRGLYFFFCVLRIWGMYTHATLVVYVGS